LATPYSFITDHKGSKLYYISLEEEPYITYATKDKQGRHDHKLDIAEFIDVKGWKANGNRLHTGTINSVKEVAAPAPDKLSTGDTIEFDLDDSEPDQPELF